LSRDAEFEKALAHRPTDGPWNRRAFAAGRSWRGRYRRPPLQGAGCERTSGSGCRRPARRLGVPLPLIRRYRARACPHRSRLLAELRRMTSKVAELRRESLESRNAVFSGWCRRRRRRRRYHPASADV